MAVLGCSHIFSFQPFGISYSRFGGTTFPFSPNQLPATGIAAISFGGIHGPGGSCM